eukprot:Em0005g1423a
METHNRLIVSDGHSVNDGINPALCSLRYTTMEIVASEAAALGPGTLITKVNIESAYRLVLVHRSQLGLRLGDKLYIDPMLPYNSILAPVLLP